jgi:hypothetical protein
MNLILCEIWRVIGEFEAEDQIEIGREWIRRGRTRFRVDFRLRVEIGI